MRQCIGALGAVSAAAMEDFQGAQAREEFRSPEGQDLTDCIRDTENAILEIDGATRRKFAMALESVNANFRPMFQTLFGGAGVVRVTTQEPGVSRLCR